MESNQFNKKELSNYHVIGSNSWSSHEYTLFFYGVIRGLRPDICVELGTFEGFSAYWIASGLFCNGKGTLDCYDLWEDYPYNHASMATAENNLANLPVKLTKMDAAAVHHLYKDKSVDFLMVDLSNDGKTYMEYLVNWYPKLSDRAIVLMEGGTPERDKVDWMCRYDKVPIGKVLRQHQFILAHYNYAITETFPGITMLTKKEFSK